MDWIVRFGHGIERHDEELHLIKTLTAEADVPR
jgi:hypothetical protein